MSDIITRCKFICTSVTKSVPWNAVDKFLYTAKFNILTDGSEETRRFFAATPFGELSVGTYKEDVFKVGGSYYLDFTEAED